MDIAVMGARRLRALNTIVAAGERLAELARQPELRERAVAIRKISGPDPQVKQLKQLEAIAEFFSAVVSMADQQVEQLQQEAAPAGPAETTEETAADEEDELPAPDLDDEGDDETSASGEPATRAAAKPRKAKQEPKHGRKH